MKKVTKPKIGKFYVWKRCEGPIIVQVVDIFETAKTVYIRVAEVPEDYKDLHAMYMCYKGEIIMVNIDDLCELTTKIDPSKVYNVKYNVYHGGDFKTSCIQPHNTRIIAPSGEHAICLIMNFIERYYAESLGYKVEVCKETIYDGKIQATKDGNIRFWSNFEAYQARNQF